MARAKRGRGRSTGRGDARLIEGGLAVGLAVLGADCAPRAGSNARAPETPGGQQGAPAARRPPTGAAAAGDAGALVVDEAAVAARFEPYAVTAQDFARRVLYTWTTRDQVDALRADPAVLLSREVSPVYGPAYYDRVMEARAAEGDRVAALLRRPGFRRARFAWTAPWATRLGWETEAYGDELIRVTLRPEAYTARYAVASRAWRVHDAAGREVPVEDLVAHPERLAAVHFVQDELVPHTPQWVLASMGPYAMRRAPGTYREYVLCNESMIEEWSVATDDVRAEVDRGVEALLGLRAYVAQGAPAVGAERWPATVVAAWHASERPRLPTPRFAASLALLNDQYLPVAPALERVIAAMRASRPAAPPLVHRPAARFALEGGAGAGGGDAGAGGGAAARDAGGSARDAGVPPRRRGTY